MLKEYHSNINQFDKSRKMTQKTKFSNEKNETKCLTAHVLLVTEERPQQCDVKLRQPEGAGDLGGRVPPPDHQGRGAVTVWGQNIQPYSDCVIYCFIQCIVLFSIAIVLYNECYNS